MHQLQNERIPDRLYRRDIFLGANDDARDGDAIAVGKCLPQQRVGMAPLFGRLEIVGLVEKHRADLVELDELDDVHGLSRLGVDLCEVLVGQQDVLTLFILVALDDLVPRDGFSVNAADALVLDAPLVLLVEHIEGEIVGLYRRKELDWNSDEPEVNGSRPDCMCHSPTILPKARACLLPPFRPKPIGLGAGSLEPLFLPRFRPPEVPLTLDAARQRADRELGELVGRGYARAPAGKGLDLGPVQWGRDRCAVPGAYRVGRDHGLAKTDLDVV